MPAKNEETVFAELYYRRNGLIETRKELEEIADNTANSLITRQMARSALEEVYLEIHECSKHINALVLEANKKDPLWKRLFTN